PKIRVCIGEAERRLLVRPVSRIEEKLLPVRIAVALKTARTVARIGGIGIDIAANAADRCLPAEIAVAARFGAARHALGVISRILLEIDRTAERRTAMAQRIGPAIDRNIACHARLKLADDEGTIRLVDGQAVFKQLNAPAQGIALYAGAANVEARLIHASKEFLQYDTRLIGKRRSERCGA